MSCNEQAQGVGPVPVRLESHLVAVVWPPESSATTLPRKAMLHLIVIWDLICARMPRIPGYSAFAIDAPSIRRSNSTIAPVCWGGSEMSELIPLAMIRRPYCGACETPGIGASDCPTTGRSYCRFSPLPATGPQAFGVLARLRTGQLAAA